MSTAHFQLVRKGTQLRDSEREVRVEIDRPNPGILGGRFGREKFVVPKKDLLPPIDMDGKPIRVRLRETHEVNIYPEFRLRGVVDGGGGARLAFALYHGYDQQIPTLRELLDGIFRRFLGLNPAADQVEKIAGHHTPDYKTLQQQVAEDLGLDVEWTLQPEPKSAQWLRSLIRLSPVSKEVTFNEKVPVIKLKLAFSLGIERASISNLNKLQDRAQLALPPAQEFDHIIERIHKIAEPAFLSPLIGVSLWNRDLVEKFAVDGLAPVLSERLERDLGYVVKLSDIVPQPSEGTVAAIEQITSGGGLERDYRRAEELVEKLKTDLHNKLMWGGNFDKVKDLEADVALAETKLAQARQSLLGARRKNLDLVQAVEPALLDDMRQKFRTAVMLEEKANSEKRYGGGS